MLITLKSNVFDDPANPGTGSEDNLNQANQFTNYFPGSLILKKNSSVALLNMTYNIKEGFIVPPGGATLILYLPPDNLPITKTIPGGSYTGPELATAIQTALQTSARLLASEYAWPANGFLCTFDTTKSEFNIDIKWNPGPNDETIVSTQNLATLNPGGGILGGLIRNPTAAATAYEALYYKTSILQNFTTATIVSQFAGQDYLMNGMGLNISSLTQDNAWFGVYEIQHPAGSVGVRTRAVLAHSTLNSLDNANIALGFTPGPNNSSLVVAYERGPLGGVAQALTFTNTQTALPNEVFRILVPVQYASQPDTHDYAIYQKFQSGVWQTMDLNPASASIRYKINATDKVFFRGVIEDPAIINQIPVTTNIASRVGGINIAGLFYQTPGTEYFAGERVLIEAPNGAVTSATGYISSVNATGGITGLVLEYIGENYSNGMVNLTVTGYESGQADARVSITAITNHATIASGGSGYVVGDEFRQVGETNGVRIKVVTVVAGAITEFSVIESSSPARPYTPGNQMFFSSNGGAGTQAQIFFRGVRNFYPYMKNLRVNGYVNHTTALPDNVSNPLGLHQKARLEASTLGPVIGLSGTTNALITMPGETGAVLDPIPTQATPTNRIANNLLVHIDSFPITSYHKNGQGRCISALPFGEGSTHGLFHDRAYNLTYHSLENKKDENHNEMRVRITDAEGNLLQGLQHPTVLNLDVRPTSL